MPVNVTCPECGKSLKAPDEFLGKKVVCPGCSSSFLASPPPRKAASAEGSILAGAGHKAAASGAANFKAAPAAAAETAAPKNGAPDAAPRRQAPPPPPPASPQPRPVRRPAQHARFIADRAAETRVQLGADGRLPDLVLSDDPVKDTDENDEEAAGSNPLLLIGVLCFSITVSVVMLFVDVEADRPDSASKTQAREQIQLHYTASGGEVVQPYERILRGALQAHNRRDYPLERRRYRRVLDMLHDESHHGLVGLTGPRESHTPPNDKHLEELLSTLLRNE